MLSTPYETYFYTPAYLQYNFDRSGLKITGILLQALIFEETLPNIFKALTFSKWKIKSNFNFDRL